MVSSRFLTQSPVRHWLWLEERQNAAPQNTLLWYTDHFELQAFEISKCREMLSLNNPHLSKDKSSKRNVINPLPRGVISQEGLTHNMERKLEVDPTL